MDRGAPKRKRRPLQPGWNSRVGVEAELNVKDYSWRESLKPCEVIVFISSTSERKPLRQCRSWTPARLLVERDRRGLGAGARCPRPRPQTIEPSLPGWRKRKARQSARDRSAEKPTPRDRRSKDT